MKYLMDTCVISEMVTKRPSVKVLQFIDQVEESCLYLSVITLGEIRKGIEELSSAKKKQSLTQWLQEDLKVRFEGRILALDEEIFQVWGSLMAHLKKKGTPMPIIDSLIASSCLAKELTLLTRNEKDFLNSNIKWLNPWKKAL